METIVSSIRRARNLDRPSQAPTRQARLPQLRDAMQHKPVVLGADYCVREALDALLGANAPAALVIDGSGQPIGEFSETAALRVLGSAAYHGSARGGCRKVRDAMLPGVPAIDAEADPFALAERLVVSGHELAAVMQQGKLVASVSRRGLLRLLARVDDPDCSPQERLACRSEGSAEGIPPLR